MEVTWGLMIVIYLFTAGLSAGAMLTSNIALLRGGNEFERISRWGAYISPFPIALGTGMLLLDLGSPFNFYQLFLTLQVRSPMSYGSWAILLFTGLSFIYFYLWLPEKVQLLGCPKNGERWKNRFAKFMPVLAVIVASYTGILLNAARRALWFTPLLPVLFFVSALSTGIAAVILLASFSRRNRARHGELIFLVRFDLILIVVEGLIFGLMFILGRAGSLSEASAFSSLLVGDFAWIFWLCIVGLGLILPLILEWIELKGKIPVKWAVPITLSSSFLVLLGGFFVRYVVTYAGQSTGWF